MRTFRFIHQKTHEIHVIIAEDLCSVLIVLIGELGYDLESE